MVDGVTCPDGAFTGFWVIDEANGFRMDTLGGYCIERGGDKTHYCYATNRDGMPMCIWVHNYNALGVNIGDCVEEVSAGLLVRCSYQDRWEVLGCCSGSTGGGSCGWNNGVCGGGCPENYFCDNLFDGCKCYQNPANEKQLELDLVLYT